jgi:hypothetical protein
MDPFLEWLQSLSLPTWIAESDSIWSFPTVLFVHAVGMGLTAGIIFVVGLRLLGVGRPLPLSSVRVLFKIFWVGFFVNLITGSLLFAAHATSTGHVPVYYAKLVLIAIGLVLVYPMQKFVNGDGSDGAIPASVKGVAVLSLAVWVGVITTGRFIAYLQ